MKKLQSVLYAFLCFDVLPNLASCGVTETFYEGCSKTKGCQGFPDNCIEGKTCTVAVSYQGLSEDKYKFEIIGKSKGDPAQYIAAGLSTSGSMGDSSVMACFIEENNPHVEMYWNVGFTTSTPLADLQLGLSEGSAVVEDGQMFCTFIRDSLTEFETPTTRPKNVTFDLNLNEYTLVFATGNLVTGKLNYHEGKGKTKTKFLLSEFNSFHIPEYDGCSVEKGCVGSPSGCLESRNCTIFASYSGVTDTQYKFELYGKADKDTSSYIAVGLSSSPGMPDTSVIACSKFNDQTRIERYWNEEYNSLPLADTSLGLSNVSVEYTDGFLHCSVISESLFKFSTPVEPAKDVEFDLNVDPYYVLLARGPLNDQGFLIQHTENFKTTEKIEIFEFGKAHPVYNGCSTEKGCFGFPSGCVEQKNCTILSTYTGISEEEYQFEIYGKADKETSSYVAVGLSLSPNMTDTSVVACSKFKDQSRIEMYWNQGYESKPLNNTSLGLSNSSIEYSDGYLYCSVVRKSITSFATPFDPEKTAEFDLNKIAYHLLLARGALNVQEGLLVKHTEKFKSDEQFKLSDFNSFLDGGDDVYEGCEVSKGCFGLPPGCEQSGSCQMVSTYVTQPNGDVTFQIHGETGSNDYLALGLANTNKMYDASVMFCYAIGVKNGVAMSWNAPEGERDSVILEDPLFGIKNPTSKYENGRMTCAFTREKITNVTVPFAGKGIESIDLSTSFYLLLAKGPLSGSRSDLGFQMSIHSDELASLNKVNLSR